MIRYTRHADEVIRQRGIERAWVERTVAAPHHQEPDPLDPALVRAFAVIPERDGRVLRVVYATEADGLRIVTAFFDRGQRR